MAQTGGIDRYRGRDRQGARVDEVGVNWSRERVGGSPDNGGQPSVDGPSPDRSGQMGSVEASARPMPRHASSDADGLATDASQSTDGSRSTDANWLLAHTIAVAAKTRYHLLA